MENQETQGREGAETQRKSSFFLASLRLCAFALLSSLLLVLAFPPFDLWWLGFIAVAPLMWAATHADRARNGFLLGWLTGTFFYFGSCWWATHSLITYGGIPTPVAYLLIFIAAVIVGLPTGLFGWALHYTTRRKSLVGLWCAPLYWAATEYFRAEVMQFGWNPLANTVALHPILVSPARFGGSYLVGVTLVMFAGLALLPLYDRRQTLKAAIGVVVLGGAIYGVNYLDREIIFKPGAGSISISAVQPMAPIETDDPAEYEAALERQRTFARQGLTNAELKLVILPESQTAIDLTVPDQELLADIRKLNDEGVYVLTNATRRVGKKFTNLAVMFQPDGQRIEYQKMKLMPFGEYVPFRQYLPFEFTPLSVDAAEGTHPVVLPIGNELKVGAAICFESAFPNLHRDLRKQGAGFFVNIANDGWFGPTPGSDQHLRHLVLRAAENGCPVVRVTNTGTSCLIDSRGRVLEVLPKQQPAVGAWSLKTGPLKLRQTTFYTRYGDVFAWLCLVGSLFVIVRTLWHRLELFIEDLKELVAGD